MCLRVQASAALLLRPPRATAPETAPTRATSWCVPRSPSLSSSRAEPTWRLKPSERVSATRWRLAGARGGHDRHDYAAHPLTRRTHAAAWTAGARPAGRLQYGGAAGLLVARRRREALSECLTFASGRWEGSPLHRALRVQHSPPKQADPGTLSLFASGPLKFYFRHHTSHRCHLLQMREFPRQASGVR